MKIYRHRHKPAETAITILHPNGQTSQPAAALPLGAVMSTVQRLAETSQAEQDQTWRILEHEEERAQVVRRAATGEVWTWQS